MKKNITQNTPKNKNARKSERIPEHACALESENIPESKCIPENKSIPEHKPVPENENIPEHKPVPENESIPEHKPVPENENIPEHKPVPENESIPEQYRTIEDDFFFCGMLLPVLLLAVWAILFLCPGLQRFVKLPPCWFHKISGYYCPGCGGTRAVRALLHGDILRAIWLHPFVPYTVAVYLYFMATQSIERISHGKFAVGMRYRNCLVWIAVALIIGSFIMKNILHAIYR